jgi:2-keto-4-pentenoate hydratase/2-oxohepta-3-ene-1,7-dioic acid hydratase in catechol pathway
VCVGRNYRAHAEELGNEVPEEPLLFFKPSSALLASGQPLPLPRGHQRIDMESELVAVVGQQATAVTPARALEHVAGYTLGNDVSNRDHQRGDKQWTRGKGFDGSAPCGPFVRLWPPGTPLPGTARIRGYLDEELRQDSSLDLMIFDLATVLAYVSRVMTLEPGDLVYTGTPEGVSALTPRLHHHRRRHRLHPSAPSPPRCSEVRHHARQPRRQARPRRAVHRARDRPRRLVAARALTATASRA